MITNTYGEGGGGIQVLCWLGGHLMRKSLILHHFDENFLNLNCYCTNTQCPPGGSCICGFLSSKNRTAGGRHRAYAGWTEIEFQFNLKLTKRFSQQSTTLLPRSASTRELETHSFFPPTFAWSRKFLTWT